MNSGYPNPSQILPLFFKINRQARIRWTITVNDSEPNTTGWTWQLFIKKNPGDRLNVISLTLGNGLAYEIYSDTILVASFTSAQTNIGEGEYYYELVRTDIETTWAEGSAFFQFAKTGTDVIETSNFTINVDSSGTPITLAVASSQIINVYGVTQAQLDTKQDKPTVVSSNTTAAIDGVYHVTASATFTDPSPTEGKGYTVFVRNGTATIGGTPYATAGTIIKRVYHSGAWASYVSLDSSSVIGLQDLYIPAVAMWPRTTSGCAALAKTEMTTSLVNIQSLDFDQTTQEHAQFTISLPRNWNNGTVTAKFYWTAASGSGTVTWGIQGGAYSNDDALTTALGTAQTVTDTLIAANDLHISDATSAITLAGTPADADFLAFQIYRDISDTLSADAKLLGVVITLTTDAAIAS